jgi:hypothetical protein
MTFHDSQNDESLAAVADLSPYDVSRRHAGRLRTRCHAVLQAQARPNASAGSRDGTLFRRVIGPALAGAWCLGYLVEIIRRAAAVYGF